MDVNSSRRNSEWGQTESREEGLEYVCGGGNRSTSGRMREKDADAVGRGTGVRGMTGRRGLCVCLTSLYPFTHQIIPFRGNEKARRRLRLITAVHRTEVRDHRATGSLTTGGHGVQVGLERRRDDEAERPTGRRDRGTLPLPLLHRSILIPVVMVTSYRMTGRRVKWQILFLLPLLMRMMNQMRAGATAGEAVTATATTLHRDRLPPLLLMPSDCCCR